MIQPIYLDASRVKTNIEEIEKKTGRPVILVHGDPKNAVLDLQEDLRDKIALKVLPVYIDDQLSHAKIVDIDEVISFSYEIADAFLNRKNR